MSNRKTITVLFAVLSLLFLSYALLLRGLYWSLLWPSLSFALVSLSYAKLGPSLLAKRTDGSLPMFTYLLLWPYLLLSWLGWRGLVLAQGKEPWNEVSPDIFVGRRLEEHELPSDIAVIVDLTCEFATKHPTKEKRRYLCLPTLDATAPELSEFLSLVQELRGAEGRVYIHCAAGHGRSATFAAALLLTRGIAQHVEEAERLMQKHRKKIKLNQEQRALLIQAGNGERGTGQER